MDYPLKDQSGVALVLALVMIVILTLIGLASTYTSTFEMKLSGNKRGTTDAFYAADSGVQVVTANVDNFSLPGKYVDNKYDPSLMQVTLTPQELKCSFNMIRRRRVPRGDRASAPSA